VTPPNRRERLSEAEPAWRPERGGIWHRFFARGPTSEERLEEFLAERRRELEEYTARFDERLADLERREELLRDSRASVERLLRLGNRDLDARESDLADLVLELTEREGALRGAEAELARRRGELGAVELKRAALERRQEALEAREAQVAAAEAQLAELPAAPSVEESSTAPSGAELAFVPGPSYRLVEIEPVHLVTGGGMELDGGQYVVARVGASPLPGDRRRCAYLVREARGYSRSGGSL
jgi:hypothetical protein